MLNFLMADSWRTIHALIILVVQTPDAYKVYAICSKNQIFWSSMSPRDKEKLSHISIHAENLSIGRVFDLIKLIIKTNGCHQLKGSYHRNYRMSSSINCSVFEITYLSYREAIFKQIRIQLGNWALPKRGQGGLNI